MPRRVEYNRGMVRGYFQVGIIWVGIVSSVLTAASLGAAEVWVVDDGVRVDPIDGSLIEERAPFQGAAVDESYRERNPVWDGESGRIQLFGGRNEVVAFQVIVDGGPHRAVSLEVSDLRSSNGTLNAGDHIRRYVEWFVEVQQESSFCSVYPGIPSPVPLVTSLGPGWYPDALIPLELSVDPGFGQPFDIPQSRNEIAGQTAAAFWVDVLIPASLTAGRYRGEITVLVSGETTTVPLELEVGAFTLSAYNHAGIGTVNYGGLARPLRERGGDEALVPWFQLAHAHRFELDAVWMTTDFDEMSGYVDWAGWTEMWRPFLSGSAFTPSAGYWGPSSGEPIRRFVLPMESSWPTGTLEPGSPEYEELWQEALTMLESILVEEGWTDVEAHLFIDRLDEPRDVETYELIGYYGDLIAGAGLRQPENVLFRLDSGCFKNVGEFLEGWSPQRIFGEIGDAIDVWNHNGAAAYCDSSATLERLADHPDEMWWFYASCSAGEPGTGSLMLEGEALGARTWGWIVYRYDLAGAVNWEFDAHQNAACWRDPLCSTFGQNGDAVLVYVGDYVGLPMRPIPSIRLKNLRRGAQDHEYLRLLEVADGNRERTDSIARRILPRALDDGLSQDGSSGRWAHDPRLWDAARRELADALVGQIDR